MNKKFIEDVEKSGLAKPMNIFTIGGEDGILLRIFKKIGTTNKYFVDIGSNDGINSNCANLAFHHHWGGTFIDGNKRVLNRGQYIYSRYFGKEATRFSFIHAIVTTANINTLLAETDIPKEPDLLCIDLDGNDYHIWQAVACISPKVVVVEVQIEKGDTAFVPDYSTEYELYEDGNPKGASPLSMTVLAKQKKYSLVAVNDGAYNLFFVRNDCMKDLDELNLSEVMRN
jgi:hypothetical protein